MSWDCVFIGIAVTLLVYDFFRRWHLEHELEVERLKNRTLTLTIANLALKTKTLT